MDDTDKVDETVENIETIDLSQKEEAKAVAEEPAQSDEKDTAQQPDQDNTADSPAPPPKQGAGKFARFKNWYKTKKKLSIPLTIAVLLAIILLIPTTRYNVLGIFIKKDFSVLVIDSETNKPVSDTSVSLHGISGSTDKDGKATLHVPVGRSDLSLSKKYYKDQTISVLVPLSSNSNPYQVKFEATGRQVPVSVTNKISHAPIANAVVSAAGTKTTTDSQGKATIVLPQDQPTIQGSITSPGFNDKQIKITVTEDQSDKNNFPITPAGKLYFLSKLSGDIDVVKTNLDGSDRKTVLAGTGKEDEGNTILLASRDWKYLALLSQREGAEKLYLIETASDKLSVIDEGKATFTLSGWLNDNFIYTVNRSNVHEWQNKQYSVKGFNADTKKLVTLDDSKATGTNDNDFAELSAQSIYLTDEKVVFASTWLASDNAALTGKKNLIISVNADGSQKQTLKSVPADDGAYIDAVAYKPAEVYFALHDPSKTTYLEYDDNQLKSADGLNNDKFYGFYPTYLLSPSGKQTSWYEPRDGKNTLFVGDGSGSNGKQIASLTDLVAYGWYTDDYLLYSKNDSELYVFPAKSTDISLALKVTDYHKPEYNFTGYGGGYGGF